MAELSVADTQQRILALNADDKPFRYTAEGEAIVGEWKVADVKWSNLIAGGGVDEAYRITVTLDPGERTYSYTEHKSAGESQWGVQSGGGLSFEKRRSTLKGKTWGKTWGGGLASRVEQDEEPAGHSYGYRFDTAEIKGPLLQTLAECGWQAKKAGLLARLFGR